MFISSGAVFTLRRVTVHQWKRHRSTSCALRMRRHISSSFLHRHLLHGISIHRHLHRGNTYKADNNVLSHLDLVPTDVRELLTSIANMSLDIVDLSRLQTLNQLTKCLKKTPSVALRTWETVGVVSKLIELQHCGLIEIEEEARIILSLLGYAPPYSGKGLRILSIDGGGTRGLVPITILKHLESMCGRPVHELFDFVCGTSTGSLLAALICMQKLSITECEEYYLHLSSEVFKMNHLQGIPQLLINHAFYNAKLLEKIIRQVDCTNVPIYETSKHHGVPRICFVSTVANQSVVKPHLFSNYRHHPKHAEVAHYQCTCDVDCWEAIMASTAAPGFFEEVKLGKYIFMDGGIATNNPCGVAIHESRLLWGKDTPIQTVVSLGTGLYNKQPTDQDKISSTSFKEKIIKVVDGATNTEIVHAILSDVYHPSVYYRFQPDLSEEIMFDESRPEKLVQLCEDAEKFVSLHKRLLEKAAASLMTDKTPQQKLHVWFNSKWNKICRKMYPQFYRINVS